MNAFNLCMRQEQAFIERRTQRFKINKRLSVCSSRPVEFRQLTLTLLVNLKRIKVDQSPLPNKWKLIESEYRTNVGDRHNKRNPFIWAT